MIAEPALDSGSSGLRESALSLADLGLYVFPLHGIRDGRCTCANPECSSPGKHPRIGGGAYAATTDREQIADWWAKWPNANIGVACEQSGIVVSDIDPQNGGEETWHALEKELGNDISNTWMVLTGGGGSHLYYRSPSDVQITSGNNRLGSGIDVKAAGGFVVGPGSMHASGVQYSWEHSLGPDVCELAPLPPALLTRLVDQGAVNGSPSVLSALSRPAAPVPERISSGQRNATLTSLGAASSGAAWERQ